MGKVPPHTVPGNVHCEKNLISILHFLRTNENPLEVVQSSVANSGIANILMSQHSSTEGVALSRTTKRRTCAPFAAALAARAFSDSDSMWSAKYRAR